MHVAYQSWGAGPHFVGVPPFVQNIEAMWADPSGKYPYFLQRIGGFARVTHFDKRGTGLSDRVSGANAIEARIDDIRAVMDDAGIERAYLGGISEGGPLAILFAATYPERVAGLLLGSTTARFVQAADYPYGAPPEDFAALADQVARHWATPLSLLVPVWMPSMIQDETFRRWVMTYERACASPGAVRDIFTFIGAIDVRSALASIQCPTTIVTRAQDLIVAPEHGRYLAEHIPHARLVALPGIDHTPWVGDVDAYVDEIEQFITGSRGSHANAERVLATVLFTDIVGSTQRASQMGDSRWRDLLDRHDDVVRVQLDRFNGREVKTTGDGFLATFDSPSRAVRAAVAICEAARDAGLEVRAGLHTGEVEMRGGDIAGLAVHVGARVAALAGPSEVLVSSTVRDLVLGSEFRFNDRGRHQLKGIDGDWQLLAVAK